MNRDRPHVFGLGELLWDLLPQGRQLGGAPANFAYFAGALGARAYVVSRMGRDELGDETLQRLVGMGLDVSHITRDSQHETGKASVELGPAGVPRFVIHEPAAWDFIPASAGLLEQLAHADAVCFGTLGQRHLVSRDSIRRMVCAVPTTALRVLDINLRAPFYDEPVITESLRQANILKLNMDELAIISGMYGLTGDEIARLRALQQRFDLDLVAMTKGEDGSVIIRGEAVSQHLGIPTDVKDTIGAGDSFTAALVMGLLQGLELDTLHERAARLASYVCSQVGATPPVPSGFVTGQGF